MESVESILSIEEVEILGDNVAMEPIEYEVVDGIYRGISSDGKADQGRVVKVSSSAKTSDGKKILVGDILIFNKYAPDKIYVNGREYLILHAEDIKGRKYVKRRKAKN